jgi:hypothetical protein
MPKPKRNVRASPARAAVAPPNPLALPVSLAGAACLLVNGVLMIMGTGHSFLLSGLGVLLAVAGLLMRSSRAVGPAE